MKKTLFTAALLCAIFLTPSIIHAQLGEVPDAESPVKLYRTASVNLKQKRLKVDYGPWHPVRRVVQAWADEKNENPNLLCAVKDSIVENLENFDGFKSIKFFRLVFQNQTETNRGLWMPSLDSALVDAKWFSIEIPSIKCWIEDTTIYAPQLTSGDNLEMALFSQIVETKSPNVVWEASEDGWNKKSCDLLGKTTMVFKDGRGDFISSFQVRKWQFNQRIKNNYRCISVDGASIAFSFSFNKDNDTRPVNLWFKDTLSTIYISKYMSLGEKEIFAVYIF